MINFDFVMYRTQKSGIYAVNTEGATVEEVNGLIEGIKDTYSFVGSKENVIYFKKIV